MRNDSSKKLPRGVSFDKTHRGRAKYKTRVFHNGKDRFIGRFETVEQASKAYQQALSAFRKSPADADSSEFLQQVRALVHGNGTISPRNDSGSNAEPIKARESSKTRVSATPSSQLLEKLPSLPGSLLRQLSLPSSHSNSVNSGSYAGDVNCPTTAAAAAALDSMQLDCCIPAAYMPYNGSYAAERLQGTTDQLLEDVMAQELFKAIDTGALFPTAHQPKQQRQRTAQPAQQQQQQQENQQGRPGLLRISSSCGDIAAAYMQLQQQDEETMARSCTLPTVTGAVSAAAAAAPAPAYTQQHQEQWQQPQQGARSCTLPTVSTAAAAGVQGSAQGAPCADNAFCSAPLLPLQQQQHQQDTEAELQQLLEMVLQGAGELEADIAAGAGAAAAVPILSPAELHELAVQQCCFEFLAATASPAVSGPPGAAMQALSAPAGLAGFQGTTQLQQVGRGVGAALSGPPAAGTVAAAAAAAGGGGCLTAHTGRADAEVSVYPQGTGGNVCIPTGRTSIEVSSHNTQIESHDRPGGLVRQNSLLMQTDTCLEAVLYVAAVTRAVLDLYTAMLHRLFEEDAAADLLQWLSAFRQQQQYRGPASIPPSAGSPAAAANLEALNLSVIEVLGKMVCMLVSVGNSTPAMPAQSSTVGSSGSRASSPRRPRPGTPVACGIAAGAAGAVAAAGAARVGSSAVPLASRAFVMAVLERLNGCLARLHAVLQQQQNLAARPAAMWQQVQCWMQQLHAQAASPEDHMAVQLAALI